MLGILPDLMQHQAYADASMIHAIARHEAAAGDTELHTLLHHILVAHRYWIQLCMGVQLMTEAESKVDDSLEPLMARYQQTQALEREWIEGLKESDLARTVESPYFPGQHFAIIEALMQVCLHSQAHRAQCATRLRTLGGAPPPAMDFIVWLKDRPAPDWS